LQNRIGQLLAAMDGWDTIMTKIAIYARVSKTDGTQDAERQLYELKQFSNAQGWKVVEIVTEHISGRKKNREGTKKLINLAKSNQIQKVLVHEISRLGRNLSDTCNTIEILKDNKVSLYAYNQKQETLDNNYELTRYANDILPVLVDLAAEESKTLSTRIKSGLNLAKSKGTKLGRPKIIKHKNEDKIIELLNNNISVRKAAEAANVSPRTVMAIKKKVK
jgi:DNA invertase Pin-like site-specific DNA recombinase